MGEGLKWKQHHMNVHGRSKCVDWGTLYWEHSRAEGVAEDEYGGDVKSKELVYNNYY